MAEGRAHYRASFRLVPRKPGADPLRSLWGQMLPWVKGKISLNPMMEQYGFYQGATFGTPHHIFLRTVNHLFDDGRVVWGMSLLHPCQGVRGRHWRTDLVAQVVSGSIHVSIRLAHVLTRGYVGPPPAEPDPSVPGFVRGLFDPRLWEVRDGGQVFEPEPRLLRVGDGAALRDLLFSEQRYAPVVVMTPDRTGHYQISPDLLASVLYGAAHVYVVAQDTDLDTLIKEITCLIPFSLRVVWGMTRIYQPGIPTSGLVNWDKEGRRHRFFNGHSVTHSPLELVRILVRGVALRPDLPGEMGDFDQALALTQKAQLEVLTRRVKEHAQGDAELTEWLALAEAENTRLAQKVSGLESAVAGLEEQVVSLDDELARARYRAQQAEQAAEDLRFEISQQSRRLKTVDGLARLPKTLPEVLDLLAGLFAGQVVFTEEAYTSAAESSFDHIPSAYEALYALICHLPPLLFTQNLGLRQALVKLGELTGLDATANEGEMTRADAKLMATTRKVFYQGIEYSIEPHLKLARGRRSFLRVHFAPDPERQRLIVGHCGDHMETTGTRRGRGK